MLLSRSPPPQPCIRSPDPSQSQYAGPPSGQSSSSPSDSSVRIRSCSVHQQSWSDNSRVPPLQQMPFQTPSSSTWKLLATPGRQRSTLPSSAHSRPASHCPGSQSPSPSSQGPHLLDAQ